MNETEARGLGEVGLTPETSQHLEGLGRRLASEIRTVVNAIPVEHRTVRSMAAFLGVDRNLCQRSVSAASSTKDGLDVIAKAPSMPQLSMFADACANARLKNSIVKSLRAAIQDVSNFAVRTCGNESKLRGLLRKSRPRDPFAVDTGTEESGIRRVMFEQAATIAGSSAEIRASVGIIWPGDDEPKSIDLSMVAAYQGHSCREGGMPLTAFFHENRDFESDPDNVSGRNPYVHAPKAPRRVLLERFCSTPLPFIAPHGPEEMAHHVVDPSAYRANRAIDVATLHQTLGVPHPLYRADDPYIDILLHVAVPLKRLIFDFYIHRSLARQCIPFFGVFALGQGIELSIRKAWYRQLPSGGTLELLGAGHRNVATLGWVRHRELVDHVFDSLGYDSNQAIGYRAEVAYPVWGMSYAMGFDFSEEKSVP